jgi:hypothetical protein
VAGPERFPVRVWLGALAVFCLAVGLYPAPLVDIAHTWATAITYLILP